MFLSDLGQTGVNTGETSKKVPSHLIGPYTSTLCVFLSAIDEIQKSHKIWMK